MEESTFICDTCGKEKTGKMYQMYDENYNIELDLFECEECFAYRLDGDFLES